MRLLMIAEYYPRYVRALYASTTGLAERPFEEQLETVLDDGFMWHSAMARRFQDRGHEVFFSLAEMEPLQRRWCAEAGIPCNSRAWRFETLLAQVERFRPDVIWIGSLFQYYGKFLHRLRAICPNVVAWIACTTPASLDLSPLSLIVTSHSNMAESFKKRGARVQRMLPGFEPRMLDRTPAVERDIAFSFIGSFSWRHRRRMGLLSHLAQRVPLQVWGQGLPVEPGWLRWRQAARHCWPSLIHSPIDGCLHGEAWGTDMFALLRRSRITLNVHGEIAGGLSGNIRMFEATGMGALLLTERAPNLNEMFEPDHEVGVFSTAEELEQKVNHYLQHADEAAAIARRGQQRTLRDHTSIRRAEELERLLYREFPALRSARNAAHPSAEA